MKNTLTLFLFTICYVVIAQSNNLVEYKFTTKLGIDDVFREYLVFNDSELYYANLTNDAKLNYEDERLEKESFNYEPIYINLKTDSLYQQRIGIYKKNGGSYSLFILAETKPIMNWKVTKESKKILGYTCYKATTKFRGRDYTAWFTPDIPYNLGPWKLGGLPGLILKVENDLFDYDAIRIVLNSDKIPTIPKLKNFENAKRKYTMTRTIEFENNWLTYLKNNFIASLPTGNRVQESPLRKDVREFLIDE